MNTPFGPAINLGTLDAPSYAGTACAIAYLHGIHTAFQTLKDLDNWATSPESAVLDCVQALEDVLTQALPDPTAPDGRDPNQPQPTVAWSNNPQKRDRT